jgi:heme/copper-type cytochrome/quinol oxidase subunit 2
MDKIFLRVFFFVSLTMFTVSVHAQDSLQLEKPQMAELMRSNGKIYVVVAVLVIILIGLFIYLVQLDRKLSRLEKDTVAKPGPNQQRS